MIYVVEDDGGIRGLVVYALQNSGFAATGFESAEELDGAMKVERPEMILLDVMLPGEDGFSILARLRKGAATKNIPVIMMTARDAEIDKVSALDGGADDYVTKPFGVTELVSRVKAVLRRCAPDTGTEYKFGNVVLSERAHTITVCGAPVETTLKEYELLLCLMKNEGRVMSRDTLLDSVWGYNFDGETRTVDVHVRTLRAKLGERGDIVETVRGVGYRIGGIK